MIVTGQTLPIYLTQNDDGKWETIYLNNAPEGLSIYSLSTFEYEDGFPKGYYWYVPKVVRSGDILGNQVILIGNVFTELYPRSGTIYIDGTRVDLTFSSYSASVSDVVALINSQVVSALGTGYVGFASVHDTNRIKLVSPKSENSSIVIVDEPLFGELGLIPGEYYGDLPLEFRSYVEEEEYLLVQETTTPNNGDRSAKFIAVIEDNNFLKNFPEFDRSLIESNPRLKILVDAFAHGLDILNREIDRTIDQINIDNMDDDIIEYIAYLFDIDVNELLQDDRLFSAREIIRSLMRTIQLKGTSQSFFNMMNAIGFDSLIREVRLDGTEILPQGITNQDIDEYYKRFIIKDSEFRNPVVNYGTLLNTEADLPLTSYDGEIVKLVVDNKIVQYSTTTETWETLYDTVNPINGLGNDPVDEVRALDWLFVSDAKPYINIKEQTYNELSLLSGFKMLSGNGTDFTNDFYTSTTFDSDPLVTNAFIIGNAGNYDFSDPSSQVLQILVNEEVLIDIDFTSFPSRITDITNVTLAQVKQVIEQYTTELQVSQTTVGRIVIASTRYGTRSSLRIISGNPALGIDTGRYIVAGKESTTVRVTAGTANITDSNVESPEVSTVETDITIRSVTDGTPLDGVYTFWVDTAGDIIVSSQRNFYQAVFDPDIGYITKEFDADNTVQIGSIRIIAGEVARLTPEPKQDEFTYDTNLSQEQETAVRAFVRSKLATASLDGLSETSLPYPISYYYRDGERNTSQTGTPGVENAVELEITTYDPATTTINNALAQQIDIVVNYIRPVHLSLLDILVNLAPFIGGNIWYQGKDRATPGFWDDSQIPVYFGRDLLLINTIKGINVDSLILGANQINQAFFYLGSDPILAQDGSLATESDIIIKVDGAVVPSTEYTLDAGTGLVEITNGTYHPTASIYGFFYTTDGRFADEIDIRVDLETAYGLGDSRESAWFTNGEALAENTVTPSSGENHDPFNTPADRENILRTEYSDYALDFDDFDINNDDYEVNLTVDTILFDVLELVDKTNFVIGDTVTETGSGVTATVIGVSPVDNTITVAGRSGAFTVSQNITSGSGGNTTIFAIDFTGTKPVTTSDFTPYHIPPTPYNSLKKPMVDNLVHLFPIQKVFAAGTAKVDQNIETTGIPPSGIPVLFDNTLAYYDAPKPYNLGADYFTGTDIATIKPSYSLHMGYHNGKRFNNANSIAQVRLNEVLFLGSENYSGGQLGYMSVSPYSDASGYLIDNNYNVGGEHRGHGIYAASIQILIDNSQPTEVVHYIENGVDLISGDNLATIEADTSVNHRLVML